MTDLDAITFCGSWDADDCAFTNEGQPPEWACGFHQLVAEVRRLRGHSIDLNSIGWATAEALGMVPDGADRINGEPVVQVATLIAERDDARAAIARVRALHEHEPPNGLDRTGWCRRCHEDWPCSTIHALDGDA